MAWEPATAIRPADAPSENNRSRREGTWKECTTRTDTRRRVSGFTTVVMSTPGELTEWKNHTKAAMAPAATATMAHPDGWERVRYEKTMPAVMSTDGGDGCRQRHLGQRGAGGDGHEDRAQAGGPEPDGVLRGSGAVRARRIASSTLTWRLELRR